MKILSSFLLILFSLSLVLPVPAFADDIAVVVNGSYPVANTTLQVIKQIYMGDKKYEGSLLLKLIDQQGSSLIRRKFTEKVFSSTVEEFRGYWLKRLFQEGALPPTVKANSQEVIDTVIQENGSIGYIWAEEAKGKSGIKVILTIK